MGNTASQQEPISPIACRPSDTLSAMPPPSRSQLAADIDKRPLCNWLNASQDNVPGE
jgi:hypothetical protein